MKFRKVLDWEKDLQDYFLAWFIYVLWTCLMHLKKLIF